MLERSELQADYDELVICYVHGVENIAMTQEFVGLFGSYRYRVVTQENKKCGS